MKTKVLVIGALPPPTGGMETVMEQMMSLEFEDYKLIPFNVAKDSLIKSNIIFNVINFIYRCIKLFFVLLWKKPQIVHIHTTTDNDFKQKSLFLKISKIFRKKTILHIHGGRFPQFYEESKNKEKIRKILQSADGLIVLTEGWKKFYKEIHANNNIEVLLNTVDLDLIKKYYKYRTKSETKRLLFVGRIERQKGIYELLEAMKDLRKENVQLSIMGPFMDNEKEIKELCKKYQITDKVTFLGVIRGNDRFKQFAHSDIFVLPSYYEGLPMTILEAMAFGMPIIATKVGAIPEIIKKENGILIEPKNVKELEKIIIKTDKKIQKKNISEIQKKYNLKNIQKKLITLYEK